MAQARLAQADFRSFEAQLKRTIRTRMVRSIRIASGTLFKEIAEILADKITESPEYSALKTTLRGAFGFTDEELANIDGIAKLLVPGPGNDITKIKAKVSGAEMSLILDWVDLNKLKRHPLAQHELTKFNNKTKSFSTLTAIVSWVEWLEDGVTVRGYEFDPTQRGLFSRSRMGIMRQKEGGLWTFQPTGIFKKTANTNVTKQLRKGFGVIFKKVK